MKLKVRKDNRKENNCCINKDEVYNTSFGFQSCQTLIKGLVSHGHKGPYTRKWVQELMEEKGWKKGTENDERKNSLRESSQVWGMYQSGLRLKV